MDDFAEKPGEPNMFGLVQGESNAIAPRKRPLSSMTPTIVTRDGKLDMVIGAPGGSRIITAVLQVFLNMADFDMNVQDAVDAPRFHHQWKPDKLEFERGFSPDTLALLKQRGHNIDDLKYTVIARVEAIRVNKGQPAGRGGVPDESQKNRTPPPRVAGSFTGWIEGGSDGRGVGKAAGY
jgi:gamma-glutamyltranspeptidase